MIPIRDINPTRSTPWVTWSIILLCGLVFLWQSLMPMYAEMSFVQSWGLVPRRITDGGDANAYITVLSSMFMHGGWIHVLGNLWFLYIFGDNVEDNMGSVRFAFFYIASGLTAAAAQVLTDTTSVLPMVGASGAIAGVLAAYLVLFPRARVVTLLPIFIFIQWIELPAVVFIAIWFVLQFLSGVGSLAHGSTGGVAYWAHIGGFVAGLAMVFLLRKPAAIDPNAGWRVVRRMPSNFRRDS
jgi:membrane associated rhomboid family serine protease